jgi:hypothetical protein
MTTSVILDALTTKTTEIRDQIAVLERRITQQRADLGNVMVTLRMLGPTASAQLGKAKHVPSATREVHCAWRDQHAVPGCPARRRQPRVGGRDRGQGEDAKGWMCPTRRSGPTWEAGWSGCCIGWGASSARYLIYSFLDPP